ncbi:MAG TPA: hypothetical protein VFE07_11555 [Marmoricola sp.]|jgi:hypothetical protein|nr:hypothetical protein [Marmoricola sp.]
MRTFGRAVAVGIGVTLLLQSGAAVGGILGRPDPVGDLWRTPIGASSYAPAPRHVEGDITRIRVAHARRAVWVRVRFRELTTTSNGDFHLVGIRSDRRNRLIRIDALPGHWEGTATVTNEHGRVVPCAIRFRIDYDHGVFSMRVPRACLGRPDWVRVGMRTTVAGPSYAYVDDARATGYRSSLAYGRRVRR